MMLLKVLRFGMERSPKNLECLPTQLAKTKAGLQLATDVVALSLYMYDLRLWRGMTACNYFMALNFDKKALGS